MATSHERLSRSASPSPLSIRKLGLRGKYRRKKEMTASCESLESLSDSEDLDAMKSADDIYDDEEKWPDILEYVRVNIKGQDSVFEGPFGPCNVTYCDWTASGKPLQHIEDFIEEYVFPFYSNTHTSSTYSAFQTGKMREESREIIKKCVNATDEDAVIFSGSGTTGAIHKLIHCLQINGEKARKTVVFIGPYEHTSNILPWEETGAKVIRMSEITFGKVDLESLEKYLEEYRDLGYFMITSFSAASNVTGILSDTVQIAETVHKYGAIVVFDYATGAPYMTIDMNASQTGYKDALICSPHKFVGGPGTPGLLIAKKKLFNNPTPGQCGGGTVAYVLKGKYKYLDDIEEREEGGTPNIIGCIRAGLAFQLKQAIGEKLIEEIEDRYAKLAFQTWKSNPNIIILGSHTARRLPIFSLIFKHRESAKFLHHNYVATLLNDLYGISGRGGCACAGPYAQDLLGMDDVTSEKFIVFLDGSALKCSTDDAQLHDIQTLPLMKPGFLRINLAYFYEQETIDFILHAVDVVATIGWKLLPQYAFDAKTGEWRHRKFGQPSFSSLHKIFYEEGRFHFKTKTDHKKRIIPLKEIAERANAVFEAQDEEVKNMKAEDLEYDLPVPEDLRHLIWFLEPKVAHTFIANPILQSMVLKHTPSPFKPKRRSLMHMRAKLQSAIRKAVQTGQCDRKAASNVLKDVDEI